ncbi:MAG: PIN domain-containing protein [Oscillatoriales cyanobacterium C42_A2020_001]|nr:PIN domain-containing protein [Leptolyngbyaceae cyanobacterium C42_A2020_001]
MSDKLFLDTNLWVYFFTKDPQTKSQNIEALIDHHADSIFMSTQVLGELYHVLTRKQLFSRQEAEAFVVRLISDFPIIPIDTFSVTQSISFNLRYGYTYWDSLIIATALSSDCTVLYSEDMQHNQLIENKLRIINPFISLVP